MGEQIQSLVFTRRLPFPSNSWVKYLLVSLVISFQNKNRREREKTIKWVITDSLWATKDAQKEGLEDIASMFIHGKSFHTVVSSLSLHHFSIYVPIPNAYTWSREYPIWHLVEMPAKKQLSVNVMLVGQSRSGLHNKRTRCSACIKKWNILYSRPTFEI